MGKVLPGGETEKEKTLNEQLDIANNSTVHATRINGLSTKLLQGKMIGAILETAIQSDLSGMVRAEITEPVYSSNGKRLLIPQGSRVVGQYTGGLKNGQSRIFIVWQRVITPSGIDVALNSPGTGPLGRAGHGGWIDSHFWERFGSSILLSILGGGTSALAGFAADGNQQAISNTQQGFNRSAEIALENSINIKPTLHKNHGESIKIFVARDIDFKRVLEAQYARN